MKNKGNQIEIVGGGVNRTDKEGPEALFIEDAQRL